MAEGNSNTEIKKRDWGAQNKALRNVVKEAAEDLVGAALRWDEERNAPCKRGRGRPKEFSDEMIEKAMTLKAVTGMDWRKAAGLIAAILSAVGLEGISCTQLFDRAKALAMANTYSKDPLPGVLIAGVQNAGNRERRTVAVDASGIRLNIMGKWLTKQWNGKEVTGWIKLHVAADVDTNEILAFVITTERIGDNTCFVRLMDMLRDEGVDVKKVLADTSYDDGDNWNLMKERGIEFFANPKKNSTGKFNGCSSRGLQVLRRMEIGETEWKIEIGYGMRWKIECTFSDFKRLFGDMITSRKPLWMALELYWRTLAHNLYKGILMRHRAEGRASC